jgi:hypothetical protein
MKYALSLGYDCRILSATYPEYASKDAVLVDTLPEGDITHYRYVDGNIIKRTDDEINADIEVIEETTPSQLDIIEAQVTYTAMMANTLLEV